MQFIRRKSSECKPSRLNDKHASELRAVKKCEKTKQTMTSHPKEEFACSCLEAALEACEKRQHARSQKQFRKFIALLEAYNLCPPQDLLPTPIDCNRIPSLSDKLPGDAIPLLLYALASCWRKHKYLDEASEAIRLVVEIVNEDENLSFLRQNVFQEAARYFIESEQFEEADELLTKELAIVNRKGSKVLLDFVTVNWLINKGELHAQRSEFDEAESSYRKALSLIESEWEPRPEQVDKLYSSWTKLEESVKRAQ